VGAKVIEASPEEDGTDLDGDDANVERRFVTDEPEPEVALAEVTNEIEARSHRLTEDEIEVGAG